MSLGIQKGGMLNSKKLRLTKEILLVKLIHPTRKARTVMVEPRQIFFPSVNKKESNNNTIMPEAQQNQLNSQSSCIAFSRVKKEKKR